MLRPAEIVLATVCGLLVVSIAGTEILPAVILGSVLAVVSLVGVRARVTGAGGAGGSDRLATVFAIGWMAMMFGPAHNFSHRSTAVAIATPGPDALLEFLYFGAAAALAVAGVRATSRDLGSSRIPIPMFGLSAFATMSFLWSSIFLYSFARGVELLMTAVLAWATMNVALLVPGFLRVVIERFLRWTVRATVALVIVGVVFGPIYVPVSEANAGRFAWIGAHPNATAFLCGVAILAIVASPPDVIRLHGAGMAAALAVLGYGAYAAQARTTIVAFGAAIAFLVANAARRSRVARYVSLPYVVAAAGVGIFYFQDEFLDYFYRGQSSDEVSGGNGRNELWSDAYRLLETPFDWAFGLGYSQSRQVFTPDKSWATNAHSSVLGILVNLGIIGLILLTAWVVYMLVMAVKARFHDDRLGTALLALMVFAIVHAVAAESASYPGTGNALLMLVTASAAATARGSATRTDTGVGPPIEGDESSDGRDEREAGSPLAPRIASDGSAPSRE